MALPFLPHREIRPMFVRLSVQAETQPLRDLIAYIQNQWIDSTIFPQKTGVFSMSRSVPITTSKDGTML